MSRRLSVGLSIISALVALALVVNPFSPIELMVGAHPRAPSEPSHFLGPSRVFHASAAVAEALRRPSVCAAPCVVATIPFPWSPWGGAYDRAKGEVFITNNNNQGTGFCPYDYTNVSVVSDSTNTILTTIQVPGGACAAVYDPARGEVFVSSTNANLVSIINDTNNSIVAKIPWGLGPMGLAYDPQLGEVFVAVTGSKAIEAISDSTNSVVGAVFLPNGLYRPEPWFVTYDNARKEVFATDGRDSTVSVIDVGTLTVNATVTDTGWPEQITYDPIHGEVLESDNQNSGTSTVNDTTNSWTNWGGDLGTSPTGAVYAAACGCSFFSVRAANEVAELNDATGQMVHPVAVGVSPETLIYDSVKQEIFAATESSNNVSVISVPGASPPALASVSVSPPSATLFTGASQTFTATPSCTGGPCPSGTAYAWTMNRALGTLNTTTGSVVKFTAGSSPGTTHLFVNATLNGVTVQSAAVPITITSGGPPRYGVGFSISPAGCGPVAFNGSAQASGTNVTFLAGSYSATANPCSNFAFQQWNATGGVSPARSSSASTPVTISGDGSLTAWYVWNGGGGITATVNFVISPTSCGPISFGGLNENNGASGIFATGNYSASAPTCAGGTFSKWTVSGSLSLPSLAGNPTTVWVKGSGTLTATYAFSRPPPAYAIGFEVSPVACAPVLFNGTLYANASSATFPTGTYPAHAPACAGYSFSDWTYVPPGGGIHLYTTAWANISIFANGTITAYYGPIPLPLSVALVANATSVVAGRSATLTPTVSGGASPYTCLWSLNGTNTSQTGCGAAALTFPHPGTYTYRVWATDGASAVAESNAVAVTVSAPPSPPKLVAFANATSLAGSISTSCAVSATRVTGQYDDNFTGNARGGSPAYAFSWTVGGGYPPSAAGRNVSYIFDLTGTYMVSLWVNDSRGMMARANLTVTISIDNSGLSCGPHVGGLSPFAQFLLVAALVAVAVAIPLVLLWRRRSGREPPPPPAPATAAPLEERPPSW